MELKWDGIERRKSLRAEAESMVARFYPEHFVNMLPEKLLQELLIHKIELELQNEELRLAYVSMQEMRSRYVDLYDFAPVGYMTINQKGVIAEINSTGSELFGVEPDGMLNQRLSNLIAPEDQDRWYLMFIKMMELSKGEKQAFCLTLERGDGLLFTAYLDCQRWESLDGQAVLRLTLIDLNNIQGAINQYTFNAIPDQ